MRTSSITGSGKKLKINLEKDQAKRGNGGYSRGRISVVGIGPGSLEHLTPKARTEIEAADVVVGYGTYIKLIQSIVKTGAEVVSGTMGKEVERAQIAVNKDKTPVPVEIVPGVTAATAASAILGAPLVSDFAVISLSDLLTPWEKIERRLEAAASADFSIVLYNPQSQGRIEPLMKAYEIMLKHINPKTPVGIVRQAGREGENYTITTLKDMLNCEIDMVTTIVVGNSATKVVNGKMVTARGYDLLN